MIIWDTETTGLVKPSTVPLSEQPKIIEFAGIKVDNKTLKEVARLEFLVNPEQILDPIITKITRITDAMLEKEEPFIAHYEELADFYVGETHMAAHNLGFDRDMLTFDLTRIDKLRNFPWPMRHICTVEASYPIRNHRLKLSMLHEIVKGAQHKEAHRAMADVEALTECVRWLKKKGYIAL